MSTNDGLTVAELARTVEDFAQEHRTWVRKPVLVENAGSVPGFTAEIVMYERTPAEAHIRKLNLAATDLKQSDIGTAIEYLRRVRSIADAIDNKSVTTECYLRLPLFLQKAGRMDESLAEFEILLANVDRYIHVHSQMSALSVEHSRHGYLATIYDKLRLAWKREKNNAKSAEAEKAYWLHRNEQQRLWSLLEEERKAEMEQWRREREARRARP